MFSAPDGFTNRDIRARLASTQLLRSCADDPKKASAKVGRCFRRLHAHGERIYPQNIAQEGLPEVIPVETCCLGWQESLAQLAQLVESEIPD